jgi:hypothetical protein
MAIEAGLQIPLPNVPSNGIEKPTLTIEQENRILALYEEDKILFDSITLAGMVYKVPVTVEAINEYRNSLIETARLKRQHTEQGGFEFMGQTFPSDRGSQAMINGAFVAAQSDPEFTTVWQVSPEQFVELDSPAIIAMGQALRTHVANAFASQANIVSQLVSAVTHEELQAIVPQI